MTTASMSQPMPSYLANRGYKVWNHAEEPMIRQPFNHNNNNQPSFNLNSHHKLHSSHHDNRKDLEKMTVKKESVPEEVNEKRRNFYSLKTTNKLINRPMPSYLLHRGYKVWNHAEEPMMRPPPSIYSHNNNFPSLRWNRSHHDLGKLIEETVAEEVNERWLY